MSIAQQLTSLLVERRSIRGFMATAIPDDDLRAVFETAQRAPSWCNIQPWRIALTKPPFTKTVADALLHAARTTAPAPEIPFLVDYPPPYREHRRACGAVLYQSMNIARDDKSARYDAWLRNFACFDAPHLAVVSVDRALGTYAYVDIGVWLGYLFAAAASRGIATCAMASIATYPEPLRRHLNIDDGQTILFGIALGYENPAVDANQCRTSRDPIDSNLRWFSHSDS
jgi:nitroreductase